MAWWHKAMHLAMSVDSFYPLTTSLWNLVLVRIDASKMLGCFASLLWIIEDSLDLEVWWSSLSKLSSPSLT